jgi:hypothetical protein
MDTVHEGSGAARVPASIWLACLLVGAIFGWSCDSGGAEPAAGAPSDADAVVDSAAPDSSTSDSGVSQRGDDAGTSTGVFDHPCESVSERLPFAGCLVEAGVPAPGGPVYETEIEVSGTVVETGRGMPPDNCFYRCEHLGGCHGEQELSMLTRWVRFEDAGVVWTAAVLAPDEISWVSAGDSVTARYRYEVGIFGTDQGHLEVTRGGELVAWVGQAGTAEALPAPAGFAFSQGQQLCEESEGECGSWSAYTLGVSVAGKSGTAGYRQPPLEIAGYEVRVAVLEHQTTTETGCLDWSVANAAAIVWAAP